MKETWMPASTIQRPKHEGKGRTWNPHPSTLPFKPFGLTSFLEQINLSSENSPFAFRLTTGMAGGADTEMLQLSSQIPSLATRKNML